LVGSLNFDHANVLQRYAALNLGRTELKNKMQ